MRTLPCALALAVFVAASSLGLAACSWSTVTRTSVSQVQQSGLVTAPSPGLAATPLVSRGRFAVQGGLDGAAGPFETVDRANGRVAHLVPGLGVHGALLLRPASFLELGFGGRVSLPGAMSMTASDLNADSFGGAVSGRFDTQVRFVFNPRSPVRFGTSLGFGLIAVPYAQSGTTTNTTTTTTTTKAFGSSTGTRTTTEMWTRGGSFFEPQFTLALIVTGDPHPRLGLLGGLTVQNQRVLPGVDVFTDVCTTMRDSTCEVQDARQRRPGRPLALTQAFVSAELRLGAVSLIGSAHVSLPVHALLVQSGLVGGSLDLRYTFGRGLP